MTSGRQDLDAVIAKLQEADAALLGARGLVLSDTMRIDAAYLAVTDVLALLLAEAPHLNQVQVQENQEVTRVEAMGNSKDNPTASENETKDATVSLIHVSPEFDAGYSKGYAEGLDESAGDPRVERIEAGFRAIHAATNGEYSREDMVVMDALQCARDFAIRLVRREEHIRQLISERDAPLTAPAPVTPTQGRDRG